MGESTKPAGWGTPPTPSNGWGAPAQSGGWEDAAFTTTTSLNDQASKTYQIQQFEKELAKIGDKQARIEYLKRNKSRLAGLISIERMIFMTEVDYNQLVADEKFDEARDKVESAQKEKKISASDAANFLKAIKEAEAGKRVPEVLDTLKTIEALAESAPQKIPANGVPKEKTVLLRPSGIEILVNSDNPAELQIIRDLVMAAYEKDSKDPKPIGLSNPSSTPVPNKAPIPHFALKGIGEISFKLEKIGEGADSEEALMYSPVDKKYQKMLIRLGFLQQEATVPINRFKHNGIEIIIQARTRFIKGKYCYATKQAMMQFYASQVAVKSLITLGDIKAWGIESGLLAKLEKIGEALKTGNNTPLENLLDGLGSEDQKKVLEVVAKQGRVTLGNLQSWDIDPALLAKLNKIAESRSGINTPLDELLAGLDKTKDTAAKKKLLEIVANEKQYKKPPIFLSDFKTWGASALYVKLKLIAARLGTGEYTTLSLLLDELKRTGDMETRQAVLKLVVEKEKIDAGFTPGNIARLEAAYKEYQSTALALYFKLDADKASGAYKGVLDPHIYAVNGKEVNSIDEDPERKSALEQIALKLTKTRQKFSTEPYLKMAPKKSLEKENFPKLIEAILAFYNDYTEEIRGVKQGKTSPADEASALLRTPGQLEEGQKHADATEQLIRGKLKQVDPKVINEYTYLPLGGKFNGVLETQYQANLRFERLPEGVKIEQSPVVVFDPTQAQQFADTNPFAAIHYAMARELGKTPSAVNNVITPQDIDKIIDYLFIPGMDTPAVYDPYVHYPVSSNEKELIRNTKGKVKDQTMRAILEKLAESSGNPSDPNELSSRVRLTKEEKNSLDTYYETIKDQEEFKDLAKILLQARASFLADYDIDPEIRDKLLALKAWMGTNGISSLNPQEDYFTPRPDVPAAYQEGMEIIKAMVAAARTGPSIGSGVSMDQPGTKGWFRQQLSRVWGTFKQTLAFSVNPQSIQVGVPGGVQDDRLLILKRHYWIEKGLHTDYKVKLLKAHQLKAEIDGYLAGNDPQKKPELEKAKREYDLLQTQLRVQFATLGNIDADFYAWFLEKYADDEGFASGFVAWLNSELFDLKGIEDTQTRTQMSVTGLRKLLWKGVTDPKLKFSGWQPSSGLRKIDPASATAEQIFALFVTYVKEQSLQSGQPESVHLPQAQAAQALSYMWSGEAPPENFGEMVRNYTLYLTQTKDPLEQLDIWSEGFDRKLNELSDKDITRFAEVFKRAAQERGFLEKYSSVYNSLVKLAEEIRAQKAPLTLSSEKMDDKAQQLISAFFLVNLLFGGMNLEEKGGTLRVIQGEGEGAPPESDSPWKTAGNTIAMFSPIPLNVFSPEWYKGGPASSPMGPGDLATPLGSTLLSFGPWMGLYFGPILPKQIAVNLYKSVKALAGHGDKTISLDQNGMPLVDKDGKLQFRNVGPQELLDTATQLPIMMVLFRNTPAMLYGMTGMWENLRQAVKAGKNDDYGQVSYHLGAFLLKFWISNFFVMTSPDGRFFESTFGRGLTLDRFAFRYFGKYPLKASAGLIKWALKNFNMDADPFLAKFRKFINDPNHSKFRALLDGIERLPESGVLGSLSETQAFQRFMESRVGEYVGKGARGALNAANPIAYLMEGMGRQAEGGGRGTTAARIGNLALQKTFDLAFRLSRADYWMFDRFGKFAWKNSRKLWQTRGAATQAEMEYILRQVGMSDDLVGELNPQERIFVPGSPLEPKLGKFDPNQKLNEEARLNALSEKLRETDVLIKLGKTQGREKSYKLPLSVVRVDSLAARFSPDGLAIGVVKHSTLTPNEDAQIELHISSEVLHGLSDQELDELVKRKLLELKTKGIDNPQLYFDSEFLPFEKIAASLTKASIKVDARLNGELDGLLTEENYWKLEKTLNDLGIKALTSENWPEVKAALARSLVEVVDTSGDDTSKVIWEGRAELLKDRTFYSVDEAAGRITLTEPGRKKLFGVINKPGLEADFVLLERVATQVEYELELSSFASAVEEKYLGKQFQDDLKELTDRQLTRKIEEFYKGAGKLSFGQKVEAAAYFQEAVKRSTGDDGKRRGFTLKTGQLKAGYAGSLARQDLKIAIDQGTGEGKTLTSPLAVFLQMLEGKGTAFVNTTTDTLSKRDWDTTKNLYELLGIRNRYVSRSGIDSLRIPSSGRTVLYCSFDSVRFRQLFDGLARGTYGTVLKANKSNTFILLDEGDYLVADLRNSPAIISSGADTTAADQELVLKAEETVQLMIGKGWLKKNQDNSVSVTAEAEEKFEIHLDDEANIKVGSKALQELGADPELHEYLKEALFVHRFMREGIDYKIDAGILWFSNTYTSKDPGTGRMQYGQQFEAPRHKALQAKVGATKITEPGLSSIALNVPETLSPYGAVALYSGSINPLAPQLGREGTVVLPIESDFARTRIDYPAILVSGHAQHLQKTALTIILELLEGHPVLVHVPTVSASDTDLNPKDLRAEVNRQLAEIERDPANPLNKQYQEFKKRTGGTKHLILTDEGSFDKQEKLLAEIGQEGVVAYSDVANRGMEAKLSKKIQDAQSAHRISEKGFACVTTQWKKSVRYYLQEIARIARPDPKKGARIPGILFAIYNIKDHNFSDRQIKTFLQKALLAGQEALVIMPADHPTTTPDGKAPWAGLPDSRKTEAAWLLKMSALDQTQAGQYAQDGTLPSSAQSAVKLIGAFRRAQDHALNESLFGQNLREAEGYLQKLDEEVKQALEGKISLAPIIERALLKTFELELAQAKISDTNPEWQNKNKQNKNKLDGFLKRVQELYGIKITRPKGIAPWQIKAELEKAVKDYFKFWNKNPQSGPTEAKIAAIISKRIAAARDYLSALSAQLDHPEARVFFDFGSIEEIVRGNIKKVIEERLLLEIAVGPKLGLVTEGEVDQVDGKYKRDQKLTGERLDLGRERFHYGLAGIDLAKIEPSKDFTSELEGKLKTLKEQGGIVKEGVLTISSDQETFDLAKEADVKRLNLALGALKGSDSTLRLYWQKSHGKISFIYGKTDPLVDEENYRLVRFTKELVTNNEGNLAFVSTARRQFLGDKAAFEIVSREDQITKSYDRMVELAFGAGKSAAEPKRSALATILFRQLGFTKEQAKEAETKARLVSEATTGIEAHEKGHFSNLTSGIPERSADFYLMAGGHLDSLYELMAEFHENGRLGYAISNLDKQAGKLALYSFLIDEIEHGDPIRKKVAQRFMEQALDTETGAIKGTQKLQAARKNIYTQLESEFTPTLKLVKGTEDKLTQEGLIKASAARVDRLFNPAPAAAATEKETPAEPGRWTVTPPPLPKTPPPLPKTPPPLPTESPRKTPPPLPFDLKFDLKTELKNAGIRASMNGAFERVPRDQQIEFFKLAREAGILSLDIADGIDFASPTGQPLFDEIMAGLANPDSIVREAIDYKPPLRRGGIRITLESEGPKMEVFDIQEGQRGFIGEYRPVVTIPLGAGERRLGQLARIFPDPIVMKILREKSAGIAQLNAKDYVKLITGLKLTAQGSFRTKLENVEKGKGIVDSRLAQLTAVGLSPKEMIEVGEAVAAVQSAYEKRTASVVERARKVLAGEIKLNPAELSTLILTMKTLADPAKTSENNLEKMGIKREEAKGLSDKLKKVRDKTIEGRAPAGTEAGLIKELNELAQKAGLTSKVSEASLPKLLEELADPKKIEELSKKINGKLEPKALGKLLEKLVESGQLSAERANELIKTAVQIEQKLEQKRQRKEAGEQILKQEAAGLLVGLVTLIGAEEVANLLGIENQLERFAFVLGLAHIGNTATVTIFKDGGMKIACKAFVDSANKATGLAKAIADIPGISVGSKFLGTGKIIGERIGAPLMNFSVGMVTSLATFAVVGRAYDKTLASLGVDQANPLRSSFGNTVATFALPSLAKGSVEYAEFLLGQRVKGIIAAKGAEAAAKSTTARLLGGLRFAGSALSYVFVTAEAANLLHSSLVSSYEQDVNNRVIEKLKADGVYEEGVKSFLEGILVPTLHDSLVVSNGEYLKSYRLLHPTIDKVLAEDRQTSYEIKREISLTCATLIMRDIDAGTQEAAQKIQEYFSPVAWGTITNYESLSPEVTGASGAPSSPTDSAVSHTYSEEEVFDFAAEYARDNKCGLDDPKLVAAAVAEFHLKDRSQYTGLLDKFQKVLFQSQVAYARSLDPDSIYKKSHRKNLNDDLRDMFTEKGELKPGKTAGLMSWAIRQPDYQLMIEGIEASSREIIAQGTANKGQYQTPIELKFFTNGSTDNPLDRIAEKAKANAAKEAAGEALFQHKMRIARLHGEYLETSGINKQVLGDMLKAMGDNLAWVNNQKTIDEIKTLVADFDKVSRLSNAGKLSKEQQAMLRALLTSQLDELIKLS